jgi:hypothetical protein
VGHSASRSLVDAVLSPRFFPLSYNHADEKSSFYVG